MEIFKSIYYNLRLCQWNTKSLMLRAITVHLFVMALTEIAYTTNLKMTHVLQEHTHNNLKIARNCIHNKSKNDSCSTRTHTQ